MEILDYLLHIDQHLKHLLVYYPQWFYIALFCLIFIETGVVVMPFLPGDSLLFATGMLASAFPEDIHLFGTLMLLWLAAILGDTVNYSIGKYLGNQIITKKVFGKHIIKDEDIQKTSDFFEKYGAKTIIIARFVPVVRTLAPFVAGISKMHYGNFIKYNIIGGTIWVFALTLAGYFLGRIPFVKNNFEVMVFVIIFFSLIPLFIEYLKNKRNKSN